jgi:RNA polymerase sigma-70 factor (ECF subfamily)
MDRESLADLIRRAQTQEPAAFEALVDQFSGRVFGFVFRMVGSRDEAEDLVQEVFLRIVRTIPHYRDDGRFESWLFRIAANLVRDRVRAFGRQPTHMELRPNDSGGSELDDLTPDATSPARPMELREDVDRLTAALAMLPAAEREVVLLRHYSDMSFKEIAEEMGTPLGTALARGHRGLQRLREIMTGATAPGGSGT